MNHLALTPEERRRLIECGTIQPQTDAGEHKPGRSRASSFKDEPAVCAQRGCFNYVAHVGDKYCPKHTPPQTFVQNT